MKNKKLLFVLAAAMLLAACGKGGDSSSAPESENPTSSQQAPTSSEQAPTSSEAPVSSSSQAPASSSSQAPASSSSEAPAPTPAMTKTAVELSVKNGKAYIVVKGTAENYKAGEFKFAWGLQHNKEVDGSEDFIYGSAEPADADYKEAVTIAADGTYAAEFCISDVPGLTGGLYQIYCGAKGFYEQIAATTTTQAGASVSEERVKTDAFAYNFRKDDQTSFKAAIAVDALPPMTLTEAVVYEDNGQIWVKVGGELKDAFKGLTAPDASWTPFVNFQQVGGRWTNTRVQGDNVKWLFEDGKAYLCANINFFSAGNNYNTHINFLKNAQQDCKMDADINETYVIGAKTIQVYSNTKASTSDQNEFWGNLGFRVTNTPSATVKAASLPEGVSNVKFATADYDDSSWTYIPNCEPASELKVYAPEDQTVMITWEAEKTVTAIYVDGESLYVGDHKAFFTVSEAKTYTVTFEVADSTLNFEYSEDDFWFVDAAVYRADEYADVIYPEGGTSLGWKYAEGDYVMIAGQPVDGYILNNVYVNGAEAEKVTQTNPWGEEETFFMYSFTSAGDYVVTYDLIPAVDTTITWNTETAHVDYVEVMVYTADPSADPLYAEEGSTIEWAYAEGDMAYIMAVAEDGYVISSVKVNGEDTVAMPMGGADIGGGMIAYVYQINESGDYTVTIETAVATDTSLTWSAETTGVAYTEVMVYTADPSADPLYAEEGTTLDWIYAEGDMAYIMAVADDGYLIKSVKVNGVEAVATPMGGADIGGGMTAYVFEFTESGEYTVVIEAIEMPFTEGGEAGPSDGTVENW